MTCFHEAMEAEWPGDTSRGVYADWLEDHDQPTVAMFVRRMGFRQRLWSYNIDRPLDAAHQAGHPRVACLRDRRKVFPERCWVVHLHMFTPIPDREYRVWASRIGFPPDKWVEAFETLQKLEKEGVHILEGTALWMAEASRILKRKP